MDVFKAIAGRHSYRGSFTGKKVSREDLRKIVDCGLKAPSGCNGQTTSFVVVDDLNIVLKIGDITENKVVRTAAALIVCVMETRRVYHEMSFGVEDCAAAVENMLLAVTALGYATVWLDGALRVEERARRVADLLGVPEGREVRVLLPIGVPAEKWSQREKAPFDERAWFNGWQGR